MNPSKLLVSTFVSVAIGLMPLVSSATLNTSAQQQYDAKLSAYGSVYVHKLAIDSALRAIETRDSYQASASTRSRAAFGLLTAVTLTGSGVGTYFVNDHLSEKELKKLHDFKPTAQKIAAEIIEIIKPLNEGNVTVFEDAFGVIEEWHMDVNKNKAALQKLDDLAVKLSQSEFKGIALLMAKSYEGSFTRAAQALSHYPEARLEQATSHIRGRAGVIAKSIAAALISAAAAMGYSGYEFFKDAYVYTDMYNANNLLNISTSPAREGAEAILKELDSLQGDELTARIEAYSIRSIALDAELIKIEAELNQIKNASQH